jgi:hypothetical protein
MNMDLSNPYALLSGVFIGLLGTALIVYGKKQQKLMPALTGIVLCVFPMFVASLLLTWLITGACLGGLYLTSRME